MAFDCIANFLSKFSLVINFNYYKYMGGLKTTKFSQTDNNNTLSFHELAFEI